MAPDGGENSSLETNIALLAAQVATLASNMTRMESRLEAAAASVEVREGQKLDKIGRQMDDMNHCINELERGAVARNEQLKIVIEEVQKLRASELWLKIGIIIGSIIAASIGAAIGLMR